MLPLLAQTSPVVELLLGGAQQEFFLALGILVVTLQVGQGAAFQVMLARSDACTLPPAYTVMLGMAIAILTAVLVASSAHGVAYALISFAGTVAGICFSLQNAWRLGAGSDVAYFICLFRRNALVIGVAFAGALASANRPVLGLAYGAALIASWSLVVSFSLRSRSVAQPLRGRDAALLGVGVMAAMLYRNDQNLIRASMAGAANFDTYQNLLVLGSLIQAAANAVITIAVIPKLRGGESSIRLDSINRAAGLVMIVLFTGAPILFKIFEPALLLVGALALALNQWWAVQLHRAGKSSGVYIVGGVGVGSLAALLLVGVVPSIAYVSYGLLLAVACRTHLLARR